MFNRNAVFLAEDTADNFCIPFGIHMVILGNYEPIKSIFPTIIAHINKVLLPWNEFFINVYWNNNSMQVMISHFRMDVEDL